MLHRKEIENYLLIPEAIDRAAARRVADRSRRTGKEASYEPLAKATLTAFAAEKRNYVVAQTLANHRRFERVESPGTHEAVVSESALSHFEETWKDFTGQICVIPGKEALGVVNQRLQESHGISVTPTAIIDSILPEEIPEDMRHLIDALAKFARMKME